MSIYIFGYGSLINKPSAENALKRTLQPGQIIPTVMTGYRRVWRAKEDIWFETITAQKIGLFLDLEENNKYHVNGVVIKVDETELEQLKLREKNYNFIDVSSHFDNLSHRKIFTSISKEENRLQPSDKEVFIPEEYIKIVESGCTQISKDFLNEYLLTTEKSQIPKLSGKYRFLDPIQAKYI